MNTRRAWDRGSPNLLLRLVMGGWSQQVSPASETFELGVKSLVRVVVLEPGHGREAPPEVPQTGTLTAVSSIVAHVDALIGLSVLG